jgi:hypothetical protein
VQKHSALQVCLHPSCPTDLAAAQQGVQTCCQPHHEPAEMRACLHHQSCGATWHLMCEGASGISILTLTHAQL